MKKLLLTFLTLLMCTGLILSGCQDKKSSGNEDLTSTSTNDIAKYHAELEAKLEESQEKFDNDKEILLTVNGVPVSATAVRYATLLFNATYADQENSQQLIEQEIENFFRLNAAVVSVSKENNLTISDEDWQTQIVDIINNYKTNFGEQYNSIFEDQLLQTPFYHFLYRVYSLLYSNIYELYANDADFDAKAKTKALEMMNENDYVRAKHVLIKFPQGEGEDGAVTEAQKDATFTTAKEITDRARAGEDFDALIKEYGEDPGMQANPGGYYFTKGDMLEAFETTTYALAEGEISEPVETIHGYHVILKLPLEDDAIKSSEIYMSAVDQMLNEELMGTAKDYQIIYTDKYEEKIAEYVAEYNASIEEAE